MRWKIKVFILRLLEFVIRWPYRLIQVLRWLCFVDRPRGKYVLVRWVLGLFLKGMDLMPVPQILEFVMDLIKGKTRPMSTAEQAVVKGIFGDALDLSLVGLDPTSRPVRKGRAQAYVILHTINFLHDISHATLLHECVHVWQYKKHGSVYIIDALYAQRWGGGYAYGGTAALEKNKKEGLRAFNFEQQAEIIENYFTSSGDRSIYQVYVNEIRGSSTSGADD